MIDSSEVTAPYQVVAARNLGLFLVLVLIPAAPPLRAQSDQGYVGAKVCGKCHATILRAWTDTPHSRTMQQATIQNVKGNFALGRVVLRGSTYLLQCRDNSYYITESDGQTLGTPC